MSSRQRACSILLRFRTSANLDAVELYDGGCALDALAVRFGAVRTWRLREGRSREDAVFFAVTSTR